MVGPWLAGSRLAQLTKLLTIAAQCGLCEQARETKRWRPLGRATAVYGSYCWPREASVCGACAGVSQPARMNAKVRRAGAARSALPTDERWTGDARGGGEGEWADTMLSHRSSKPRT